MFTLNQNGCSLKTRTGVHFGPEYALIAHIKANGRTCKHIKLATVENISAKLLQSLTSKPKDKRPKKVSSLRNHIASHMRIKGNELAIQGYLNQLVNDNVIFVSGDSVEYRR